MVLFDVSLIILIVVGIVLSIYGLQKKSQLSLLFGGIAFFSPILYFLGWTPFLPFVPPAALLISYVGKNKKPSVETDYS